MNKKLTIQIFIICLLGILVACGGNTESGTNQAEEQDHEEQGKESPATSSDEPITIRIAHTIDDTTNQHKGALKIKEIVEEKTEGQIEVQVFASGQLGQEREIVDAMRVNNIEMGIISAAGLSNFAPKAGVLGLPYVINGESETERYETLLTLSTTDAFNEITEEVEGVGLKMFPEAVWWYGNRHITSNEPIRLPEDLQGVIIRTPDAQIHTEPFSLLGANVTPMGFSDVYMALRTGTIDAQENPINTIYTSSFYEVQKYINLTGHMTQNQFPLIGKGFWDSLSEEYQSIIQEAITEAAAYQSELQIQDNDSQLLELEELGLEVIESDQSAFKEATKDAYKAFTDRMGEDFYERIVEAQ